MSPEESQMKTIGLLGGMSWESTKVYYQEMNRIVRSALGGLHSAQILLWSFDFEEIAGYQRQGRWDLAEARMTEAAGRLQSAGAEAILICTNTMHKLAPAVRASVTIPLLDIVDAVGSALSAASCRRPALLATKFTMEESFYKERLERNFDMKVMVPDEDGRNETHRIIFEELCQGTFRPESKRKLLEIIHTLSEQGADSVILGCTELGLLVEPSDTSLPLFDSTLLHVAQASEFALSKDDSKEEAEKYRPSKYL